MVTSRDRTDASNRERAGYRFRLHPSISECIEHGRMNTGRLINFMELKKNTNTFAQLCSIGAFTGSLSFDVDTCFWQVARSYSVSRYKNRLFERARFPLLPLPSRYTTNVYNASLCNFDIVKRGMKLQPDLHTRFVFPWSDNISEGID